MDNKSETTVTSLMWVFVVLWTVAMFVVLVLTYEDWRPKRTPKDGSAVTELISVYRMKGQDMKIFDELSTKLKAHGLSVEEVPWHVVDHNRVSFAVDVAYYEITSPELTRARAKIAVGLEHGEKGISAILHFNIHAARKEYGLSHKTAYSGLDALVQSIKYTERSLLLLSYIS